MKVRVDGPHLAIMPSGEVVIVFKERGGNRWITILLNDLTLHYLSIAVNKVQTARPTPYHLIANCINTLGSSLEEVVIDNFKDNIYHAHLYIKSGENRDLLAIDAHVTDAVIVAAIENCAVYVTEDVFKLTEEADQNESRDNDTATANSVFEKVDWDKAPKV